MKTKILICLAVLIGVAATAQRVEWPLAKLTVRVVGEQGEPIAGAKVKIGFREKLSNQDARATGETNAQGEFTAEGYSDMRLLSGATKQDFYESSSSGTIFKDSVDGKWVPWNPVAEIVLRPIGKPVPLHVKRVQSEIPVLDQACGYDLEKGDWVVPWGRGEKSDFVFAVRSDYKDRYNFSVEATLGFSQPRDGVLRMASPAYARNSLFRWERVAPEDGYAPSHTLRFKNHDPKTGIRPEISFDLNDRDHGYFFRVRTVEQNGKIVAANYGKIVSDIGVDPRESRTCRVYFTYYFNPTSLDRNLEWDTTRNLLSGLRSEETPHGP